MDKIVINDDDPVYLTRHKFEMALLSIKKQKYNIIIDFMNNLFNTEHKSLTLFKYINMEKVNIDHIKKIVKKHKKNLKEKCKMEISEDDVTEKYIISYLRKLLTSIDYSFCKRMNTGLFYVKY